MSLEIEPPIIISDLNTTGPNSGQCDCDCDCACDAYLAIGKTNKPIADHTALNANTRLYPATPSHTLPLDVTHEIRYSPRYAPVVLNRTASEILAEFEQSPLLAGKTDSLGEGEKQRFFEALHTMTALGLLTPEPEALPSVETPPTTLSAWLHVTDRCNLRCTYCYLPHEPADMTEQTGRAAIDATLRSARLHKYRQVRLKYAGGEAMLRFPFVLALHRYAIEQARKSNLELDGIVLSNGTLLTQKIAEEMQEAGLRLMISLDGLSADHDGQRPFANGRGSSALVLEAIDLALENGIVPDISITVSGRNVDGLPELMEWVLERDLPFSLNFYRENNLSATQTQLRLEEERIIAGMRAAYKVIEKKLPRRNLLASLADFSNLSMAHLRTCSVGQSYLVFDYQGNVSKCQMEINKPITNVQAEDPLVQIRSSRSGIQNLSVEEKEGCRDCEWKYWCTGGCPLSTFRATGRYDVKSPNCNIYKALYPEVIRLEGLRLLKYFGENK